MKKKDICKLELNKINSLRNCLKIWSPKLVNSERKMQF